MSYLDELNAQYLKIHTEKERAFWSQKMGHAAYVKGSYEKSETAFKYWIGDALPLKKIETELQRKDLGEQERIGLVGWKRFFEANAITVDSVKPIQAKLLEMEGNLEEKLRESDIGYMDPDSGERVHCGSDKLRLMLATHSEERFRKAAWEGLNEIGDRVLNLGFIEIVKERNRMARQLGYADYYDYKVQLNEGFPKAHLFSLLAPFEKETRQTCYASVDAVSSQMEVGGKQPWNFEYLLLGDLKQKTDPYFPFQLALERWGRSFAAMDISYRNALLQLDLVNRKQKYENGFMHGPFPAYVDGSGKFIPAQINFTSNALPNQVGAGEKALLTLFHEGGHAAHFANIEMPAPCYSQEFAPSSVAFAETQSMFMDSLVGEPDWMFRHARSRKKEQIPVTLIGEQILKGHQVLAYKFRNILVVPLVEKAIYEMKEEELTPQHILRTASEIERDILGLEGSPRPTMSIPHLLAGESSAYYHGYLLAQLAVYQTKDYFKSKYGFVTDNPEVGKELSTHYWKPGNSHTFLTFVKNLTGKEFSSDASIAAINRTFDEVVSDIQKAIEQESRIPRHSGPIELDATIRVVHGDELIASNEQGESFEELCQKFAAWLDKK